ncbi:fasciclin domain-containing protein [Labilibaculum sp.]|uniref:fasciclin domain-containing protein n=1 Tax=Labilibaculum sp. TaxID=2060723 RepID=UPI0035699D1E
MKSRNYKLHLGVFFMLFLFVFTVACKEDDDDDDVQIETMEETIVDIVVDTDDFSILEEALSKADLVTTLNGTGPFTVFAPTNDAFEALFTTLNITGIEDLSADDLTPILLYHVLGFEAISADLSNSYVESLSTYDPGDYSIQILVNVDSGVELNGATNVSSADALASNGVIHTIDQVLLPPTVVDIAIANSLFENLVAAVVKADLVDALIADGPFTVFAPTDEAFETLFTELGVSGIDDLSAEILSPILLAHVVSGNVRAADVSTGTVATLNQDFDLDIDTEGSGVVLNGSSNVIATDVQGKNGVVHVIDKVIVPSDEEEPQSIYDIVSANSDFTILMEFLISMDLDETLDSDGTFTVFAPTNDAFEILFSNLGINHFSDLSEGEGTQILLYHVLGSIEMSTDLNSGYVETLSLFPQTDFGIQLLIDTESGVLLNGSSNVTTPDVEASNGVIHIIDEGLVPPTVVDLGIANPSFTHVTAAIVRAGLEDDLRADGPFTVLAPTDTAFEELFTDLGVSGIDDIDADDLKNILLYHVVSGNIRSTDVTAGTVETLNADADLVVTIDGSDVIINDDTNIIAADVQGVNGVVHVINKVLIPD